jgi:hypothetical protein|tara:strand:- start:873 stop:1076 length:204 start_codon:yes stop_codon:yes gene_type:complete
MGILMMLKEGGSLGIDTIGNLPIDEDIDLLPDTGTVSLNVDLQLMLWSDTGFALQYLDVDEMLLLGA